MYFLKLIVGKSAGDKTFEFNERVWEKINSIAGNAGNSEEVRKFTKETKNLLRGEYNFDNCLHIILYGISEHRLYYVCMHCSIYTSL
jgi:hypothetical protein